MRVIVKGPGLRKLALALLAAVFLTYELLKGIITFSIARVLLPLLFLIPLILLLAKWVAECITLRKVKLVFSKASWDGEIVLRKEISFKRNYALLVNERRGLKVQKKLMILENWENRAGKKISVDRWGLVISDGRAALRAPLLYFSNDVTVMLIAPLNAEFKKKKIVFEEEEGKVEAEVSDFIRVRMRVERKSARGAKFFLKGEIAYEGEWGFLKPIDELLGSNMVERLVKEVKLLETKDEGEAERRLDVEEPIAIIFVGENLPKIFELKEYVGALGGNDVEYFAKIVLDLPFAKDKVKEVPLAIKS